MSVDLSLVIPAFNEAARLEAYLAEVRVHLDAVYFGRYEVLVVNDGSSDGTAGLVRAAADRWPKLRLLEHAVNQGKGAAVRTGVLATTGRVVLFADADGATPITEEQKLSAALGRGAAIAVGSRLLPGASVLRERNRLRSVGGRVFAWAARRAVRVAVRDTQCGFKMLVGSVARYLFARTRETGYLFDLELLALAAKCGCAVAEVPVNWTERAGSKVRMVRDTSRMFAGLLRLRARMASTAVVSATALARASGDEGSEDDRRRLGRAA